MMLSHTFDETKVINHLKHFLPAQAPLKDFVHHNVLHFFQNTNFHAANELATKIFGYKTYLIINEYRALYESEEINDKTLDTIIIKHKGKENLNEFKFRLLYDNLHMSFSGRIGQVMHVWKDAYKVNLSKYIQPRLFRIISNYLDQGIALVEFPYKEASFLDNIRNIEQQSYFSYFIQKKGRARQWLLQNKNLNISDLLDVLVGQQEWYEDYLFDMCFEHPGWSGIVNIIEEQPESITKKRQITFKEFIILELLFQIDYLDDRFGQWKPLATTGIMPKNHLFDKIESDPPFELLKIWQEAYEWTYYQKILKALYSTNREIQAQDKSDRPKFQTVHCIDDREESFRRHLEYIAPQCETYSIAGFFNIDAYFQPQNSDYLLKISPTPTNPSHLILEQDSKLSYHIDRSLEVQKHSYFTGWLMAQPLGYWSAIKLISHFLKPHDNPATISAKNHIHADTSLKCDRKKDSEGDLLHVGFTIDEAVDRAEELLKSIGLINNFSKIIYIIGHGAGSTNNPYYAAYDCGACSGKPGSVNARVICYFLNKPEVRKKLLEKNILIPPDTVFIPALHDTTSDEILFYDINNLTDEHKVLHQNNTNTFSKALDINAKERARRFVTHSIQNITANTVHNQVKLRTFSLFEPRPEYNHATNTICSVGRRDLSRNIFLDRRAFLQSYNYKQDLDGKLLPNILKAITPVCGGINLEYYYSRVDNQKLGAGSKLSHNIYGLIGVANGTEGDLRTALPSQMIEIHDPLRLLVIIEHYPEVVLKALDFIGDMKEWFVKEWIILVVIHPETGDFFEYKNEDFYAIDISECQAIQKININTLLDMLERNNDNLETYLIEY